MSDSAKRFLDRIDEGIDATQSVVLRYRHAVRFAEDPRLDRHFKELLDRTTLSEGLRIVPLLTCRGVRIDVLDQSSLMETRTLKSIDGCLAAAWSLVEPFDRCVFESGGNTGSALTRYAATAGLETYCIVPHENLGLLDSTLFAPPEAHLIAVTDPSEVKRSAHRLAELLKVPRIPRSGWRQQASSLIGCFVLERLLTGGGYDVIVQTISAAFAPVGIYRVLSDQLATLPMFIGIQQAANCPMVHAWRGDSENAQEAPVASTARLLNRVMYDHRPHTYGTLDQLRGILETTAGHLDTVDHAEFSRYLQQRLDGAELLDHLAAQGIEVGRRGEEILEKAGVMAVIGTLKQIEAGHIAAPARVLVCFTGGTACPDGRVAPDWVIGTADELDAIVATQSRYRSRSHV